MLLAVRQAAIVGNEAPQPRLFVADAAEEFVHLAEYQLPDAVVLYGRSYRVEVDPEERNSRDRLGSTRAHR